MPSPSQLDRPITADEIIDTVCELWYLERVDVLGWLTPQAHAYRVVVREQMIGCLRNLTSMSFPEIAALTTYRAHSTACTVYHRWLQRPAARRATELAAVHGRIYDKRLGLPPQWEDVA